MRDLSVCLGMCECVSACVCEHVYECVKVNSKKVGAPCLA